MQRSSMVLPQIDRINKAVIIAVIGFFILSAVLKLSDISLIAYTGLNAKMFFNGFIYQALSYVLVPGGLLGTLFNSLILWFIGSELAKIWGERRYIQFLGCTIVGGALFYLTVMAIFFESSPYYGLSISGPAGICSALCVAYGVLFPERTLYLIIFPVQAKWFVMIIIAMNLYTGFFSPGGGQAWSQLGAMAAGFGWMYWVSNKGKTLSAAQKRKKNLKKASHLSLIDGDQKKTDDPDKINYH